MVRYSTLRYTLFSFHKNVFYKNIEAEIYEILRIFKNKAEAEILKRIYNFVYWNICKHNTTFVFNLTV